MTLKCSMARVSGMLAAAVGAAAGAEVGCAAAGWVGCAAGGWVGCAAGGWVGCAAAGAEVGWGGGWVGAGVQDAEPMITAANKRETTVTLNAAVLCGRATLPFIALSSLDLPVSCEERRGMRTETCFACYMPNPPFLGSWWRTELEISTSFHPAGSSCLTGSRATTQGRQRRPGVPRPPAKRTASRRPCP